MIEVAIFMFALGVGSGFLAGFVVGIFYADKMARPTGENGPE